MTFDNTFSLAKDVRIPRHSRNRSVSDMEMRYEAKADGNDIEVIIKAHEEVRRTMKPVK